jgi:hypothetical protein
VGDALSHPTFAKECFYEKVSKKEMAVDYRSLWVDSGSGIPAGTV